MSLPVKKLGKNGPEISSIGLGLMGLDAYYGIVPSDEEKLSFLEKAYELGCRNWDSAALYAGSEATLGMYFSKHPEHRENIFLATKFSLDPGSFDIDSSPEKCRSSLERSLRTIGVPYVDLFYCHRVNPNTPVEHTVQAMLEAKQAGKIKYIGLSEVSAKTLRRACKITHIDCVQVEYSAFALDIEHNGLLETCRELGVAIVAYSPLGRGILSGRFRSKNDFEEGDLRRGLPKYSDENFPKNLKLVEQLQEMGRRKGYTASQLSLAWLLAQGDDIFVIPGTKNVKYLQENLGAAKVQLTIEEVAEIRKAVEACEVAGSRSFPGYESYTNMDTRELDA